MSKRYSIADARRQLPTLVTAAQAGEAIELTRRGEAVAMLVSVVEYQRLRSHAPTFHEAYARFLRGFDAEEDGLQEDALRGVRDATEGREVEL